MKVVVCEKKDQAQSVAKHMGWSEKNGQYEGQFEGDQVKVVWASGHLTRIKNPDEMIEGLSWNDVSQLTPIPRDYSLIAIKGDPKKHKNAQPETYLKRIRDAIKSCDEVILSTDSDREGETLGWMILQYLDYKGPVRRAWLAGGLEKTTIQNAFKNLRSQGNTKSWFRAGEARNRSDRAFMFLVRAYTYYARYGVFGRTLGEGRGKQGVMGVGRVQTPTLAMVTRREDEIQNFVSVKHYKVSGLFSSTDDSGEIEANYTPRVTEEIIENRPEGVKWEASKEPPKENGKQPLERPLFTSKEKVEDFKKRLFNNSEKATVLSYSEGHSKSKPPKTYDLGSAQMDIESKLKINSDLVQTILEDLYEQGWTSYARTSKQELPKSTYQPEERNHIFNALEDIDELSEQVEKAKNIHDGNDEDYSPFMPSVFTDKDLEHHGIIPTPQKMTKQALQNITPKKSSGKKGVAHSSEQMKNVYMMVARRFIQAMYPDAIFDTQEVQFKLPVKDLLDQEESFFKAKSKKIRDYGWMAAFGNGNDASSTLPKMKEGDSAKIKDVNISESNTKPPSRYKKVTLIQAMENIAKEITDPDLRKRLKLAEGIGTPATRKQIINTLIERYYITEKKDTLYPTEKGKDLIKSVPGWLSSPETTAVWEDYLNQICEIKENDNKAIEMRDNFAEKQIKKIESIIDSMSEKYSGSLKHRINESVTPKMLKTINMIESRLNIEVDKETKEDPQKAKSFLNKYMGEDAKPLPPSDKQIAFAEKLYSDIPEEEKPNWDEIKSDSKKARAFIDKYKDTRKPSQKQIDFARKLADELDQNEKPDESIFESMTKTSEFIDSQLSKNKSKPSKTKSKSKKQ